MVPVLILSLSSTVVGVVRSSVDMGRTRGWAPPSSFSSTALNYDNSCLSCILELIKNFLMLGHLIFLTTAGGRWVSINLILQKGNRFKEGALS